MSSNLLEGFVSSPDHAAFLEAKIVQLEEEMEHSSPPRSRPISLSDEAAHSRWLDRHPSALERFQEIVATAEGKKTVLFLDYNGTLAEIGEDIDHAIMTSRMREAVDSVATTFPTAIVSGSCLKKLGRFIPHEKLYYAGSHGMDIRGPGHYKESAGYVPPAAERFVPMIQNVHASLAAWTNDKIYGCMLEDKKFCLSVHYRIVHKENYRALAYMVLKELEKYEDLVLKQGRKVLEIRPKIKWDKGNAIEHLLKIPEFSDPGGVFPIYIGDDVTDEDVFQVLNEKELGVGILVSKMAKSTGASYSLRSTEEFLLRLVEWRQQK